MQIDAPISSFDLNFIIILVIEFLRKQEINN